MIQKDYFGELLVTINKSALREIYNISEMSYLDQDEAMPIYMHQANLIKKQDLSGIVDVGCRIGIINDYLTDYDYRYYGFDTSPEPISFAKSKYPTKNFDVRSWHNLIMPYFDVDVVLFSSVLIYADDPLSMFEKVCAFYQPRIAIIKEINNKNNEDFTYTDLKYFTDKYPCTTHHMSLNIPCGERTILNVQYK